MTLILKVAAIIIIHLAVFVCYNQTGEFAKYYISISIILWTGFFMFLNFGLKLIKFINRYVAYVIYACLYFLMFLTVAFTMPQKDRISAFEKIRSGQFPDDKDIRRGVAKLGFSADNIPVKELKIINKNIGKTLDKIEEKAKTAGGE